MALSEKENSKTALGTVVTCPLCGSAKRLQQTISVSLLKIHINYSKITVFHFRIAKIVINTIHRDKKQYLTL